MTTFIEGYVSGDDLQIERDVSGVDTADALVKAWLTIKTSASVADPGTIQKVITANAVQGTGQITEDGSALQGNGTASLVFQLTATDTALMGTSVRYYYDVQCKTAAGKIYTADIGKIQLSAGFTDATS